MYYITYVIYMYCITYVIYMYCIIFVIYVYYIANIIYVYCITYVIYMYCVTFENNLCGYIYVNYKVSNICALKIDLYLFNILFVC